MPPSKDQLVLDLAKARTGLIHTYVMHVVWFVVMCVFFTLQWEKHDMQASVLLTLVTLPPVLLYTVRVHKLCRSLDPKARTVGLMTALITTFVLSPFESGLTLPAKNLIAANKILKPHQQVTALAPMAKAAKQLGQA
ncbi:hypothetical protein ACFQDN_13400 [Pseudomonas asuensis]|uniref:Uncharacterized protein n=1 Tax=Pseudomonas asuensis TaxID=1825787 RepID=A0ABQ2H1V0_9PSED|nr:hypothetical protein [Pseudomonas asuensis]GGM27512.1 hypothetical protein GCM10009425_42660 [Pseudomonas asuensis]